MDIGILAGVALLVILWIIPAIFLTAKVLGLKKISPSFKRQLILPLWLLPLIGNLVCYFVFAKTGPLNRLSPEEHRRIGAVAPGK